MTTAAVLALTVLIALLEVSVEGGFCNDYTISRIDYRTITTSSPIFKPEIELYGDASVLSTRTRLTKSTTGSYGGFFLAAPTEFQGPGGFSIKFTIQAAGGGGNGDAWELIVARRNANMLPAPFGVGKAAHGRAGWSRRAALVVEFDSRNSGSSERDSSENHVSVFLDGDETCVTTHPGSFDDEQKRTIWVDYIGFQNALEIRVGPPGGGASSRPGSPTLRCSVDIWGKLDIKSRHHVGFAAYNAPSGPGAEHALVDAIAVADAYRPFDARYCAAYAPCRAKDEDGTCVVPVDTKNGICKLDPCGRRYVWDVMGNRCCGFIEKASWIPTEPVTNGTFKCVQDRRTISFTANDKFCNL